MPEVTGYTTEKVDELTDVAVVNGAIDPGTGAMTLTTAGGDTLEIGSVAVGIGSASTSAQGIVELATDAETIAGTDNVRAVTPFAMAAVVASATAKGLVELATDAETTTGTDAVRAVTPHGLAAVTTTLQPKDSDLTTIAGLSPGANDFLEFVSSAWVNRTPAQVAAVLTAVGLPIASLYNGSAYAVVNTPALYVGPTDPGSVANGSVWFDTTGA